MDLRQMTSTTAISAARPAANDVSLGLDSEELASTYERVSTRQFNHGKLLIADASRPHQSAALVRDAVLQEGLSHSKVASALGTNYRVGQKELGVLLASAGLIDVHVEAHTFVDTLDGVDDLFAWSQSSSFGNFLSDLEPPERERVRTRLSARLDELRTPDGIQLERCLVFATGRRA
jgi:arsenite methyltransferase